MSLTRIICATLAVVGMCATAPAAEQMYVKSKEVVMRAGKGAIFDPVVTVQRGAALDVVEKQGKWLKVSAGGKEGWVFADALSPRAATGGLDAGRDARAGSVGLGAAGSGIGLGEGGGAELSLKGSGWDAAAYAAANGLKADGLQKLKSYRAGVTARKWQSFAAAGGVGPK